MLEWWLRDPTYPGIQQPHFLECGLGLAPSIVAAPRMVHRLSRIRRPYRPHAVKIQSKRFAATHRYEISKGFANASEAMNNPLALA